MRFNQIVSILVVVVLVSVLLPLTVWAAAGLTGNLAVPAEEAVGPNLLTNPGMDGQFVKQCAPRNGPHWVQVPCPDDYSAQAAEIKQWETAQVPYGWSAWWRQPNDNFADPNFLQTYPAFGPNWENTPADCVPWHNPEYRDT